MTVNTIQHTNIKGKKTFHITLSTTKDDIIYIKIGEKNFNLVNKLIIKDRDEIKNIPIPKHKK